MLEALASAFHSWPEVHWTHPAGGLYVWLAFPPSIDTGPDSRLMRAALREGVLYVPGQFCYINGDNGPIPTHEARLSFGVAPPDQLQEAVRRLASRMITWMGNQVLEARHAREALATLEEHNGPVHLVVTDIKMPGMNGRELGRIIEQRWPGKPILYMSGFASEVFRDGLLEPGAPFLAKPFTQDDLAAKVRPMLEQER